MDRNCPVTAGTSSTTSNLPRRRALLIRVDSSKPTANRPQLSTYSGRLRRAGMPASEVSISGCWASSRTARNHAVTLSSPIALRKRWVLCVPAAWIWKATRELKTTDFYTSHEALLLPYEQALTRVNSTSGDWYCTSGHLVWIGDRTRQPDHAHVEFARGIHNPIGLKCGPSLKPDELLRLTDILNPKNDPGRLTLICRFGAGKLADYLPALIRAVKREGKIVVWSCDPMHGNTVTTASGYKPGRLNEFLTKSKPFLACMPPRGPMRAAYISEMTGKDVTECTGGTRSITDADLNDRYHTFCDPRLNAEQSIDMAFLLADLLKEERAGIRVANHSSCGSVDPVLAGRPWRPGSNITFLGGRGRRRGSPRANKRLCFL